MGAPPRIHHTRREATIVATLMAGRSNRAIAQELGITEQSVKNRLTKLYRKHGVRTRLQLMLTLSETEKPGR
jgi:two-component system, NarL family, nitrate/nitrite response regulator NarL